MKPGSTVRWSYIFPDWQNTGGLSFLTANEIRAVFPVWALAMILQLTMGSFSHASVAKLILAFGCCAVGAVAAGHDFMHRTLQTTLAQPAARESIWQTKFLVTLAGLAPLALVAGIQYVRREGPAPWLEAGPMAALGAFVFEPFFLGLFVAPWAALARRSVLAGTVFAVATPFVVSLAGVLMTAAQSPGASHLWGADEGSIRNTGRLSLIIILCAAGAIGGRRRFLQLEAIEPRSAGWSLLRAPVRRGQPSAAPRRGNLPAWIQLAAKEVRMQGLALVPAGAMAITLLALRLPSHNGDSSLALSMAVIWGVLACALIGAVGGAEERQLGVVQWQFLQPVSALKQFAIKTAVLLALALLITAVLPRAIAGDAIQAAAADTPFSLPKWTALAAGLLVLASLYIGSLCSNPMHAIFVSLPVCALAAAVGIAGVEALRGPLQEALAEAAASGAHWQYAFLSLAPFGVMAMSAALLFHLACRNHFSAENRGRRAFRQAKAIAGAGVLAAVTFVLWLLNLG